MQLFSKNLRLPVFYLPHLLSFEMGRCTICCMILLGKKGVLQLGSVHTTLKSTVPVYDGGYFRIQTVRPLDCVGSGAVFRLVRIGT